MSKIAGTILLLIMHVAPISKPVSFEGAWRVAEVQTVKKDGSTSSVFPTESQVLFTGKFYSFCWTTQTSNAVNWVMSDSTKLSRVNSSLINAGTFETNGNMLTTKATFAMNPKFTGGFATYIVTTSGDTLILSGTNLVAADQQLNPAYAAGSRFITKLVPLRPGKN